MDYCRSCKAPIEWRTNNRTGKPAPIDVESTPDGPVILLPDGQYQVLSRADRALPNLPERYTNHYQTCPQSADWKARQRRRTGWGGTMTDDPSTRSGQALTIRRCPAGARAAANDDGGFAVSLDRMYAAWPIRLHLHDDDHGAAVRHLSLDEGRALRDALAKAVHEGAAIARLRGDLVGAEPEAGAGT